MAWWNWLYDPTWGWPQEPTDLPPLRVLDHQVMGMPLGASFQELVRWGRTENWFPLANSRFSWFKRGVEVRLDAGTIDSISLVFLDYLDEGFHPVQAVLMADGKEFPLGVETSASALLPILGPPINADVDSEESIWSYQPSPTHGADWEFSLEGKLKRIELFCRNGAV